jgi:hypothetical protein
MNYLLEIAGWLAAVLILTAYWLLSTDRVSSRSEAYQWLNIVGAAGFVVNSSWNGAYPSAVLNIVWIGIGIFALLRNRARN